MKMRGSALSSMISLLTQTWEKLLKNIEGDKRFISNRKNTEKKYALKNIVECATPQFEDDDNVVIAVVDGDDSLCNNEAVKHFNQAHILTRK